MSRIGKAPIEIPAGVTVTVSSDNVTVKGPKGELSQKVNPDLTRLRLKTDTLVLTRPSDDREHRAQHGLYRALIHNMVVGVSQGLPQGDGARRRRISCILRGTGLLELARFLPRHLHQTSQRSESRAQRPNVTRTPSIIPESDDKLPRPRFAHSASPNLYRGQGYQVCRRGLSVASRASVSRC